MFPSLSLLKTESTPQSPDLRAAPADGDHRPDSDIVVRLRTLDSRTPFARTVILEAASEIERLRAAIRRHRDEVWTDDAPDHASDAELYRAIP
ncbi:MAG TPA: hypothetical protein VHV26_13070 [Rhizomicrobium sp.]|jgi:hypothetical protein|nr:hypothetical protein [Rhizomicrobium sp.]